MNTETLFQIIGELFVENRMLRSQSQQQMQTFQKEISGLQEELKKERDLGISESQKEKQEKA